MNHCPTHPWIATTPCAMCAMCRTQNQPEILRGAAELMRERAERATPYQWRSKRGPAEHIYAGPNGDDLVADASDRWNRRHIASWSPAVALAVASLLERLADRADEIANSIGSERVAKSVIESNLPGYLDALDLARAYLGEAS